MRRFMSLLILLLIIYTVAAQEDATFTTLTDGDVLSDQFEETILARLYSFDASAGDVVTISMAQASDDLDPYLVLLGSAGQVFATDDDSGDDTLGVLYSAQIQNFEIPADGDYLILATSFSAIRGVFDPLRDPLSYEIAINGNALPSDGDSESVTLSATEVARGDNLQLAISPQESVYFLQFAGTAGETVTLDMQSDEFDTLLYLFAPDGTRIAASDDTDGSTNSRLEEIELPQDGTYLIFAASYDFTFAVEDDWTGGGTFVFSFE